MLDDKLRPAFLPFVKMHGCENDYVVVRHDDVEGRALTSMAQAMCARRRGVGADGLLVVGASSIADLRMRMFNPDGSEAEMCGNGLRCAVQFAWEEGLVANAQRGAFTDPINVETGAGVLWASRGAAADGTITLGMGVPGLRRRDVPMLGDPGQVLDEPLAVGGLNLRITGVSMGNPHVVAFVEDVESFPLHDVGPLVEQHPAFPRRTNFEIAQVVEPNHILQRTWERGVGETRACGTGACAVVVAGVLTERTSRQVAVDLVGGRLDIVWSEAESTELAEVRLTGPTQTTYRGRFSDA